MSTAWRKTLRDAWRERTRSLLVVLATAIGIAGFGSVLSTYAILTRELNEGYLATNPASATLKTDAVDAKLIAALESGHGVAVAEARRVVTAQIKAGPAQWRNLQLFVVEDFANIRVSKLVPEQGAWPPGPGEILIERDALQVARARIGDTVSIKTASGSERTLRLSGSVHDVGQAQARMEQIVYGYVARDALVELGEQPYLDQLKIVVADEPFDEAHVRTVAAGVETWLESQGHPVRKVEVPTPGKHPHADLMGLLLLIQSSFGFFVLVLSGILVVNLLTALMAAQVRQIGVMKTIGGTRAQIARIYLGQALILGLAAFVVALGLSIAGARALCRYMAVFLNFDIHSLAVPAWVYLLEVAVGVVVPLLAAAYPVWRASGVSIRAALANFEVSRTSFGTSAFDRALAGVGGLTRPLALAVRNGFRRRTRTALTVATLAIGGLFFMSALNLRASLVRTLDGLFGTMKYDLTVTLATMYPFEQVERALHDTPGVRQAEGWITSEGSLPDAGDATVETQDVGHDGGGVGGQRFRVVGVPADTALLKPNTIAGRALEAGDTKVVVVNTTLAATEPRIEVGRDIELRIGPAVDTWRVVGIAREPFAGPVVYVPRSYFENAGHAGMVNSLRLVLDSTQPDFLDALATDLDRNLEQQGVHASSTATKADRRRSFDEHMLMIYVFLVVMSGLIASVGGLGLMTTMSLNVLERRREMGVLRAIGAAPSVVGLIVVTEALVLGLASWTLAALAAWPVSKILGDLVVQTLLKTGLDFVFEPLGPAVWLAVSLSLAVIASLVPAWRAARRPVREALGVD